MLRLTHGPLLGWSHGDFNYTEKLAKAAHPMTLRNPASSRFTGRARASIGKEESSTTDPLAAGKTVDPLPAGRENWIALASQLFAIGCAFGPPLDGIHSRVQLVVYDQGAIDIGTDALALHTNVWVFPLLGTFYAAVGLIDTWLDSFLERPKPVTLGKLALSLGVLAALLDLSAELYQRDFSYATMWPILSLAAAINWAAFDRTGRGLALAALIGVAAPLSEVPIMRVFELWHYPRPDFYLWDQGQVSWVLNCYFFYTPFLLSLSRYLRARMPSSS